MNIPTSAGISSLTQQFRQAMQEAGIVYSGEIIADGKLHRFHIEGQRQSSLNGAYTLHLDNHPAGWFQDFKSGISQKWRYSGYSPITGDSAEKIKGANRKHEAEIRQKHNAAALKATEIWQKSKLIAKQDDHPYLVKKRIQPHSARLYHDALVIPIYNESNHIANLQFIDSEGEKRFLTGGRKHGCFHIIGDPTKHILICEGFATGASLYEDTGERVVIAFDAGNLLPVTKNICELSPDSEIIVCGDNDSSGIGQIKAREAALAIGGKILIPPVAGKDWNDLITGDHQHY